MDSVSSVDQLVQMLLGSRSEWIDDTSGIDAAEHRAEWGYQRSIECGLTGRFDAGSVRSWLGVGDRSPLPIGREAMRAHPYLKMLIPHSRGIFDRLALLPGDELLYLPVVTEVSKTRCELFFLARLERTVGTIGEWKPGGVASRLTGYPDDPNVERLVKSGRLWWQYMDGKPLPMGGRPRNPLSFEDAARAWDQMRDLEEYADRTPSDREFRDFLLGELGLQISQDTFTRRKRDWKRAGRSWPPSD